MWGDAWPLLLTAFLTLAATLTVHLVIQFWAVPRVETRKRREDRWERDLIALGELLTLEQADASKALTEAVALSWAFFRSGKHPNTDPDQNLEARLRHSEVKRNIAYDYERIAVRVDWLVDRVIAPHPGTPGVQDLGAAHVEYVVAHTKMRRLAAMPMSDEITLDVLRSAGEDEREAVKGMINTIKALIGHPPLRTPLRERAGRALSQWRAPLTRHWAKRKANRKPQAARAWASEKAGRATNELVANPHRYGCACAPDARHYKHCRE